MKGWLGHRESGACYVLGSQERLHRGVRFLLTASLENKRVTRERVGYIVNGEREFLTEGR